MSAQNLREERAGIWQQMRNLLDSTEDSGMNAEQAEEYAQLEERVNALTLDIEARDRAAALEERMEKPRPTPKDVVNVQKSDTDIRTNKDYLKAFRSYMRTGVAPQELRAQSVGTDSAGGFLVPDLLRQKLVDRLKAFGGVAGAVEVIETSGGETLRWPTLDDTSNTGVIAAENTAPASGGADLVFGEKTLGAFRYVAPGAGQLPLRVSVELLQDNHFDIEGLISRKLGERIGRAQAAHWVTGNGTTEPFGIDTGTAAAAFTSAGITYPELVDAVHSVDPAYRNGAVWTFNDFTMGLIEKVVDTAGRPILNNSQNGINVGPSNATLLGYPVVIDQAWANYVDGGTNRWGAFGNLREGYVIRRVRDLTMIVNPYSRANEGQVEYVLWARADGTVQDANAFRVLINAV